MDKALPSLADADRVVRDSRHREPQAREHRLVEERVALLLVELSDRWAVMYAGRFVETARAGEIFAAPRHPYTRALMNAFPPMSGPRTRLHGLGEGVRFRDIPDLEQVGPTHWAAPGDGASLLTEAIS